MTGYQKLKAKLHLWQDFAGRLESLLLQMNVPDSIVDKERKELNNQLYKLEHEER